MISSPLPLLHHAHKSQVAIPNLLCTRHRASFAPHHYTMTRHFCQLLSETWHGLSNHGAQHHHHRPKVAARNTRVVSARSDTTESSTDVDLLIAPLPRNVPRSRPVVRHRVRFEQAKNQVHNVPDAYSHKQERWYDKDEINAFKKETFRTAQACMQLAVKTTLSQGSWSKVIRQAYYAFTMVGSTSDQQEKLWQSDHCLEAMHVGLHQWAFPDLKRDRLSRREQLQQFIKAWQRDKKQGVDALSTKCRQITQPSRQFAMYVGQLMAKQTH